MNVTFLIGNGFDLGLRLNTRYTDFLPVYCNSDTPAANHEVLSKFKNLLSGDQNKWSYTWADFERELGKRTTCSPLDDAGNFRICVSDFKKQFAAYLKKEQERMNHTPDLGVKFWNALTGFPASMPMLFRETNNFSSASYSFINFNYTNTLDAFIKSAKRSTKYADSKSSIQNLIHVHGTIDSGLILGVNDPSQIANPVLASDAANNRFGATILKPRTNEELGYGQDILAKNLIDNSSLICVYGMSIGESDRCWWEELGNWLAIANNTQLLLYIHKSDLDRTDTDSVIDAKLDVLDRFLRLSGMNESDAKRTRKRIGVILNQDIFSLDLPLKENPSSKSKITAF